MVGRKRNSLSEVRNLLSGTARVVANVSQHLLLLLLATVQLERLTRVLAEGWG
jgi:hypothetical protein